MKIGHQLETERLIIRPWQLNQNDIDFFYRIDSDEIMMRHFPWRSTREEANSKLRRMVEMAQEAGLSWAVAIKKDTLEPIGFTGLWHVTFDAPFTPAVEIGWRFIPEFWRQGFASEAAKELLRHGFEDLKLNSIIAFAVAKNLPSIKVMQTIGMVEDVNSPFDHPAVPDSHEHLKSHVLYRIDKQHWQKLHGNFTG